VHRPLGEQRQDGCAHITAAAAAVSATGSTPSPTTTAPSPARAARAEARSETEAGRAVRSESESTRAGARLAASVTSSLVHGAAAVGADGPEAELRWLGAVVWSLEWFTHGCLVSRWGTL